MKYTYTEYRKYNEKDRYTQHRLIHSHTHTHAHSPPTHKHTEQRNVQPKCQDLGLTILRISEYWWTTKNLYHRFLLQDTFYFIIISVRDRNGNFLKVAH